MGNRCGKLQEFKNFRLRRANEKFPWKYIDFEIGRQKI